MSGTVFQVFNLFAERYDSWYRRNRVTALNELRLVEEITPRRKNCIEIGGGTGFFSARLGCIDLDPAERMLALARRRGVDALQALGEHLPLRNNVADVVLIVVTLCFVDDPAGLLLESRRILRDDGVVVTCIVPRDSPWGIYYISRRDRSPFYRYARFYTLVEVHRLLEGAGLQVVDEKGILSYRPWEKPRPEAPTRPTSRHGFVCIKAAKI